MAKPQGVNTKAVGEQLKQKLDANPGKFGRLNVFYDHGDSSKPEVCEPTAYMRRRYGSDATLAAVDIVVVKGKSVILAAEIEESTFIPKTVIGDIFGITLSN